MAEGLAVIQDFLAEDAAADTAAASASSTPALLDVPKAPTLDDSQTSKTADEVAAKRQTKSPLKVIQGGKSGVKAIQDVTPSLSDMPTPGGVGLLLLIIFILLFAIVKTSSGYTRLGLIWQAIIGNAALSGASSGSSTGYVPNPNDPYNPASGAGWFDGVGGTAVVNTPGTTVNAVDGLPPQSNQSLGITW